MRDQLINYVSLARQSVPLVTCGRTIVRVIPVEVVAQDGDDICVRLILVKFDVVKRLIKRLQVWRRYNPLETTCCAEGDGCCILIRELRGWLRLIVKVERVKLRLVEEGVLNDVVRTEQHVGLLRVCIRGAFLYFLGDLDEH